MSDQLTAKLQAFDPSPPLERAETIPGFWYWDDELYRAECRHVFGATWQLVGLAEHIAVVGNFLTADIAGEPIVVLRDEQGTLRAFYNVCRHRAARLLAEPHGQAGRLRCPYHGWTYDLQGRLRGTPEFEGVENFCKEDNGLVPLAVDTWGPYVFVHGGTQPPALAQYLAPLPERARPLGLERLRFAERREYVVECNWKVFVDNFQDGGYHVHAVHPALAGALDYAHYHNELAEHTTVQISPLRPAEEADVAKVRSGDTAYYWWVFPNLMVNLYSGVMDVNYVLPLGPERCKVIFDWFFSPDADLSFVRDSIAVSDRVQREDVAISEEVQRGLRSRSYRAGRYSVRREAPVHLFHCLLARYLHLGNASEAGARRS
jgi:choline monooxygenase